MANNNLGSPEVLDVTTLTGIEGSTITGGIPVVNLVQGPDRFIVTQKVSIPPGTALAIGVKPPASNTSASASVGMTIIKQTIDFK